MSMTSDNHLMALMGVIVLTTAIPGAVMGTGFFREDWQEIYRERHCGPLQCTSTQITARPMMELLWVVQFGLLNKHPEIIYWLLNLTLAISGAAVYRILTRYVPKYIAFFTILLWATLPTHLALSHWPSVMHNDLALMLAALAILRMQSHQDWRTLALFVGSIAIYESTAPLIFFAIVFQPSISRSPRAKSFTIKGLLIVSLLTLAIAMSQINQRPEDFVNPLSVLWSNFMFATKDEAIYLVTFTCAISVTCFVLARFAIPSLRPKTDNAARYILAGLAVMTVGAVPFMSTDFDNMFVFLGDRANQIAAIGSAMIWAGIFWMAKNRTIIAVAVLVLIAITIPLRFEREADYAYVAKTTRNAVQTIQQITPHGANALTIAHHKDPRYESLSTTFEQELLIAAQSSERSVIITFVDARPGVSDPFNK